jgi:hypothetical protein
VDAPSSARDLVVQETGFHMLRQVGYENHGGQKHECHEQF